VARKRHCSLAFFWLIIGTVVNSVAKGCTAE